MSVDTPLSTPPQSSGAALSDLAQYRQRLGPAFGVHLFRSAQRLVSTEVGQPAQRLVSTEVGQHRGEATEACCASPSVSGKATSDLTEGPGEATEACCASPSEPGEATEACCASPYVSGEATPREASLRPTG
ncbi:hypothetical protein ACOMHN_009047 [Nucella lapillus]